MKLIVNEIGELLHRGLDAHVQLGVTGLSRSGKTAFITSLVNQLLYSSTHHSLPLLTCQSQGRLYGAKVVTQSNLLTPTFNYTGAIQALSSTPAQWPRPTTDVGAMRLAIRFKPKRRRKKLLTKTATLYVDILDYPGEWLLDLPLLNLSFQQWSEMQYQQLQGEKKQLAQQWVGSVANTNVTSSLSDAELHQIAEQFRAYLRQCKQAGYHFVQPGRFVLPGEYRGAPILDFFPLRHDQLQHDKVSKHSVVRTLEHRYEQYKKDIVKKFYRDNFSQLSRQIVLVDLLGALNEGKHAFNDMQQALEQVMKSFKLGKNSLLQRMFSPQTEKLLFATTKIDHVTPEQQKHVDKLLQSLIAPMWQHASFEQVALKTMSISSIKATEFGLAEHMGKKHPALTGRDLHNKPLTLFPGEVPSQLPNTEFWQQQGFEFVSFAPYSYDQQQPLKHLRMDAALEFLIGDKLW